MEVPGTAVLTHRNDSDRFNRLFINRIYRN